MKKIILIAALAVTTLGSVNTASAINWGDVFNQSFWDAVAQYQYNKNKPSTSPGDAFDPHASDTISTAELTSICVELGGTPDRRFQGNDFHFYCAQ